MDFNKFNRGDLNNLQNQDLDFDKETMWSNLEEREKRRPVFWWQLMVVGVGLVLLGSVYFFFENTNRVEDSSQFVDNQLVEKVEVETTKLNDDSRIELLEEEVAQTFVKKEKKLLQNQSKERNHKSGFIYENVTDTNSNFVSNENSNSVVENLEIPTSQSGERQPTILPNGMVENSMISKNSDLEKLDLAETIELKKSYLTVETNEEFELPKSNLSKIKKSKSPNFLITPTVGIGYQFQSLKLKGAQVDSDYLNSRKANENQFESWSFGLLIDKKLTKNLMLGTGIEYLQHNEQLLTPTETETDNIAAFDQNEVPAEFLGREGFLTKRVSNTLLNQHRLINVPLSVSWIFQTKKVRIAPSVSLVFNLSQNSTGHIENEMGTVIDMNPYFKSNIGLAYRLGCRFYYPMNSRFLLFANPQFEINPNDVSTDINPILQRRNLLKLDIGISVPIGR